MTRGTVATIRSSALLHNLRCIKKIAGDAKVWTVVKANAYGHGAVAIAKMLLNNHDASVDGFAVATFGEAEELRQAGIHDDILLLEGCPSFEQMQIAVEKNFILVVHDFQQLSWFSQLQCPVAVPVWIKVDTGLHRLGFTPEEIDTVVNTLQDSDNCDSINLMTHMACADEPDHPLNNEQICLFNKVAKSHDFSELSIANSATLITRPDCRKDWVRPGIILYGASPFAEQTAIELGLQAVMQLTAPVIAVRNVKKGDTVGYGATWRAERDCKCATIAIGYGDGYPRHAKSGTPVWFNGKTCPLVGRVSMDMLCIDVTHTEIENGDEVELWGDHLSVDEIAKWCNTISYELLTRLSQRVEYHYLDNAFNTPIASLIDHAEQKLSQDRSNDTRKKYGVAHRRYTYDPKDGFREGNISRVPCSYF